MAEDNQMLEMHHDEDGLGKVEIAPEVIEVIAGIAASEVEGLPKCAAISQAALWSALEGKTTEKA